MKQAARIFALAGACAATTACNQGLVQSRDGSGSAKSVSTSNDLQDQSAPPIKVNNTWVRIVNLRGSLHISGYANGDHANPFWRYVPLQRVIDVRPFFRNFQFARSWVSRCYDDPKCANKSTEWLGKIVADNGGKPIDDMYGNSVDKAESALIYATKEPLNYRESTITSLINFLHPGKNTIQFGVDDTSNEWAVLVDIYTLENGRETVIQSTAMSNKTGGSSQIIDLFVSDAK